MKTLKRKVGGKSKSARSRAFTARSVASGTRTKATILDVAERLFAANGFDGTSMRQIGQNANVPFALVSYHFKSKLGLYRSVFHRRLDDITKARIARFKNIDSLDDRAETVRSIVRVLVEPMVRLETASEGQNVARLIAREINDPRETDRGIIEESFDPIAQIVISKLRRTFPDVDQRTVYWAFLFTTGALAINHAATGRIERLSAGLCKSADTSGILENLIEFITGGILGAFSADMAFRSLSKQRRNQAGKAQ